LVKTALSLLSVVLIVAVASVWRRVRPRPGPRILAQAAIAASIFGLFLTAVTVAGIQSGIPADSPKPAASNYPNILLITMDTVRADHTSVYGYQRDTTPTLREFAREATLYTRGIAASDFTLPTHAALFTGLYPNWSGALAVLDPRPGHLADPLRQDTVTLAEILRAKGYRTAEVAANFGFLGPWTGLTRGFAVADLHRPVMLSTGDRPFYLRAAARKVLGLFINPGLLDRPSFNAWDINRRALPILDAMKTGPFFLFLNYLDAHTPYVPDPPFDKQFPGFDPSVNPFELHDLKLQVASGKRRILPNEKAHLISQYDGGIAEEDAAIGVVLNRLRELNLYDNTLIVITSDHGDTFGEHGLADHFLGFVYQELVHIPFLIKYPGQRAPGSSDDLVSQVDVLPTVLELLGDKAHAGIQGRSLLRPIPGDGLTVFSQGTRSGLVGVGNPRFEGLRRAVISRSMKLISWTAGPPELYDLAADPAETVNLYRPDDPRAVELSQRLSSWVAAMPPRKAPTKLDKSTIERLKSLGYTQ
jgi:arylsulfatase A-like enzyme